MSTTRSQPGLTLVELMIAVALIAVVMAILLPTLESARVLSHREQCANNLRVIGGAWSGYFTENNAMFPYIALKPAGWHYGGARFSAVNDVPYLDPDRPLTWYMPNPRGGAEAAQTFKCPADHGIGGDIAYVGTGPRTAFRAFGTSYRANDRLLHRPAVNEADPPRPTHLNEVTAPFDQLVLTGSPQWYEVSMQTGRHANWHRKSDAGNMLFLDGSVRFVTFHPQSVDAPVVYDPFSNDHSRTGQTAQQDPTESDETATRQRTWPVEWNDQHPDR